MKNKVNEDWSHEASQINRSAKDIKDEERKWKQDLNE